MNKLVSTIALVLMTSSVACGQSNTMQQRGTTISPTDSHIQYIGRISFKNPEAPMWTYPGVQIRTGFTGSSIKMIAKPNSGYFMAQIDDCEAFKVCYNSQRDSVITLAAALPKGEHQLKLMYISEGYERRPEFHGFIVEKGCSLTSAPALPERRIEFIGNSITCGYGVEAVSEKEHYFEETANHYYTYATRTAQALEAQHVTVARSGIGVYRNYNGPREGDKINMNTEYKNTLLYDNKEKWDFSRYTPQVVCINLGTNDTSTTGADERLLLKGYKDLYSQVRSSYPSAKIVFLCGSMMNGDALILAKKCMDTAMADAHKAGDKEVYRFDFEPHNGSLKYGADYHPSYWQHEKMAGELTAYLRTLMQWY
ncbi:MAG: GDSL-type esterase/lipase family protein [Bacteroidaceae bacterium]|nr:GDSL-type esterase/lipase family protein [Bacteroidaceae bacterium]